jgi:hypothetical protein
MMKADAVQIIDEHKNKLINPVEMLDWTWLRVIINSIPDEQWDAAVKKAEEVLRR